MARFPPIRRTWWSAVSASRRRRKDNRAMLPKTSIAILVLAAAASAGEPPSIPLWAHGAPRMEASGAKGWNVSPAKVGFRGFSAGGEVAALVGVHSAAAASETTDPIDRLSARPDFLVLIYPGVRADRLNITKDTPPAFLMCA